MSKLLSNCCRREQGFTILELLIVLTILMVILSFSVLSLGNFAETMQKRLFITQLQSDLYYAHAYAIHQKEPILVNFSITENKYQATVISNNKLLFQRKLPISIYLQQSNLTKFTITRDGTVSNFGTILFRVHNESIKLTFYIGRGRFSVQE
ncbi:competence type IV pilus minor pilin ComGD [Lederbergia lenta]|uniref:competence type IV pilus minor pilin ComGD n=1 Tax=Lederbergia lenta TaxID=1467 RepID=UPI00203B891A|nr:competence type IV pilus minor pilin ComGD [Lederbergia lenta]MCM3111446.1 prepilin-type N-terminal cleavage/methylation domain-containing protein [Lederbergia lenta]